MVEINRQQTQNFRIYQLYQKDVCVCSRCTKGQKFLLAIYMDDLILASTSIQQINELKRHLRKKFSMKLIGDIVYVLGLKVKWNTSNMELKLSQETYAKKVLERFGLTDYRPTICLVAPSTTLEVHKGAIVDFPYSQVVGSIMNFAIDTQPDLAYGVGLVSLFASNRKEVSSRQWREYFATFVQRLILGWYSVEALTDY